MKNDFTDRVAIVTGSSRGIGRAIAETLAGHGAQVIVNYATDLEGAEETVDKIVSKGDNATLFQADVSVLSEAEGLINYALDKYG
ncbi:MAG TPA: beta-ketoacyl-ACP reductase, partial [Chloroflexi bacterium]|nr:beta-ketoacyl-ACP reductase [Chloroflexota bacterium]